MTTTLPETFIRHQNTFREAAISRQESLRRLEAEYHQIVSAVGEGLDLLINGQVCTSEGIPFIWWLFPVDLLEAVIFLGFGETPGSATVIASVTIDQTEISWIDEHHASPAVAVDTEALLEVLYLRIAEYGTHVLSSIALTQAKAIGVTPNTFSDAPIGLSNSIESSVRISENLEPSKELFGACEEKSSNALFDTLSFTFAEFGLSLPPEKVMDELSLIQQLNIDQPWEYILYPIENSVFEVDPEDRYRPRSTYVVISAYNSKDRAIVDRLLIGIDQQIFTAEEVKDLKVFTIDPVENPGEHLNMILTQYAASLRS